MTIWSVIAEWKQCGGELILQPTTLAKHQTPPSAARCLLSKQEEKIPVQATLLLLWWCTLRWRAWWMALTVIATHSPLGLSSVLRTPTSNHCVEGNVAIMCILIFIFIVWRRHHDDGSLTKQARSKVRERCEIGRAAYQPCNVLHVLNILSACNE